MMLLQLAAASAMEVNDFRFGAQRTVGLFFDAYNLTNSNAAESQDNTVGRRQTTVGTERVDYQRFLRPTTILSPRIFKFGVKVRSRVRGNAVRTARSFSGPCRLFLDEKPIL